MQAPSSLARRTLLSAGLALSFSLATAVPVQAGTAYDVERDVHDALSDDRSQLAPARFSTLDIDLSDGALSLDPERLASRTPARC